MPDIDTLTLALQRKIIMKKIKSKIPFRVTLYLLFFFNVVQMGYLSYLLFLISTCCIGSYKSYLHNTLQVASVGLSSGLVVSGHHQLHRLYLNYSFLF